MKQFEEKVLKLVITQMIDFPLVAYDIKIIMFIWIDCIIK